MNVSKKLLPPDDEILERLRVLHDKLEAEGLYFSSNTVWLAIERLKELRP